jgi:hypothetical protein
MRNRNLEAGYVKCMQDSVGPLKTAHEDLKRREPEGAERRTFVQKNGVAEKRESRYGLARSWGPRGGETKSAAERDER